MTGFLTRAALALEPSTVSPLWPAAAPEAVSRLLPLLSENVRDTSVVLASPRTVPRAGLSPGVTRAIRVEGPVALGGVYDGLSDVWAMALGHAAITSPVTVASGVYQHVFEIDPELHSHASTVTGDDQLVRRGTLVVDRGVSCWEHLSTMCRSLTVNAGPGGVGLLLNVVAHSTDRASATHPNLDALSTPDFPEIDFTDLEVRVAPLSDSTPLDSDDVFDITTLQLNLSNNLKTRQRRDTGLYIGEPRRQNLPSVSGTFTRPYYEDDIMVDWALSKTVLMATLTFTGAEIASSGYTYKLILYLPAMQLAQASVGTPGPNDRSQRLNWRAAVSDTVASGFPASTTGTNGPLFVEVVSTESSNPFI